jgi:protein SCO1
MTKNPRRLPLVVAALAAAALAAGCGSSSSSSSSSSDPTTSTAANAKPAYEAPALAPKPQPAPDFTLRNSLGKPVSISQFRGKAVLLTFIYSHCPDVCPLIVGNLHSALEQLGPQASKMQVVAVSVDPKGDTPKAVNQFIANHEMTGRMEYLVGTKKQLAKVWKKYGVSVAGTPDSREVDHSASVYGITGKGTAVALYPANFKVDWIVHDVPLLAAN